MNFRDVPNLQKFEQYARANSENEIVMDCLQARPRTHHPCPKPPDPLKFNREPVADLKASCEAVEKSTRLIWACAAATDQIVPPLWDYLPDYTSSLDPISSASRTSSSWPSPAPRSRGSTPPTRRDNWDGQPPACLHRTNPAPSPTNTATIPSHDCLIFCASSTRSLMPEGLVKNALAPRQYAWSISSGCTEEEKMMTGSARNPPARESAPAPPSPFFRGIFQVQHHEAGQRILFHGPTYFPGPER